MNFLKKIIKYSIYLFTVLFLLSVATYIFYPDYFINIFAKTVTISSKITRNKCVVSGCNGELCLSYEESLKGGVSICMARDDIKCYKNTKCEVQPNGRCGWTENEEFKKCLKQYSDSYIDIQNVNP